MKYFYKLGILLWICVLIFNYFCILNLALFFYSGYLLLHCILCEYYPNDKITHFFQKLWVVIVLFLTFAQIIKSYPGIADFF